MVTEEVVVTVVVVEEGKGGGGARKRREREGGGRCRGQCALLQTSEDLSVGRVVEGVKRCGF